MQICREIEKIDSLGPCQIWRVPFDSLQERRSLMYEVLKDLLSQHLGQTKESIIFIRNRWGKPLLAEAFNAASLHFNISYAKDYGLIAISEKDPVGIDIEKIQETFPFEDIISTFFSQSEKEIFASLKLCEKPLAFFRAWVCKEAFIKAIGRGLSFPLNQCEVAIPLSSPAKLLSVHGSFQEAEKWRLQTFCPAVGYIAAICENV